MIIYSIIQKSQLEGALRLDAEYYQPEYLEKIAKLKSTQTIRLGDIAYITDGEHGSPIWDEKSGIKYFSAQHIRDGIIDESDVQTISKVIDDRNKRSRLQKGDILISTVGTIGFAGMVTEGIPPANIDRHVGRINLRPNTLDPEFLIAFLNSSYGRFQSFRNSTGNVQLNLFIEKIKEFLIPKNNNSQVSQLVKLFLQEKDISEKLYQQAENLLLEELGLKDYKVEDDLSFVVNLSDFKTSNRADSDYFQPKYQKLINALGKNLSTLKFFAKRRVKNVRINKNLDYKYIEISDIDVSNGEPAYNTVNGKELPANAKMEITGGELIISKVRPTRGAISIIPEDWKENFIASGAFSIFEAPSPTIEYLQVVLRSIIGKLQLEKPNTGTSYPTVTDEDVENIVIPILCEEIQQKIADLVRQSHEARKRSKELLEEAKRKVEEMIEKTGEGK